MKKLALVSAGILSVGCLGAFQLPKFGLDAEAKYASEYVTRGRKEGKSAFMPKAEVGMPIFGKGKVYVGTLAVLGTDGNWKQTRNQVAPYIGASYDVTDMFTVDLGYVHHLYTNTPKTVNVTALLPIGNRDIPSGFERNTNEVYVGVMADVLLSPSVYAYYDFDCREVALEGKVAYSFDFSRFGVNGLALDLGAKLGYDRAKKPFANKYLEEYAKVFGHKGYMYYGLNADLVYSFNEHAKARVGMSLEGNSGKKDWKRWQNAPEFAGNGHHRSFLFFTASVDCLF